jgi:ADP-heptose:LPS heptosyltransferase
MENPKNDKLINFHRELYLTSRARKVIFKNSQCPGDILMLTAAIRDLKISHPDILINVRTSHPEIWDNNHYVGPLVETDPGVEVYNADYPLIHDSNDTPYHFIHGFRKNIEEHLNLSIKPTLFRGDIHLSKNEKSWISQVEENGCKDQFWIITAGGKYDFTAKWWDPSYYQEVVDYFKGKITFVQCGRTQDWHPPLNNVIDMVGKTNLRQLIRLIYHSVGVLCPVTFTMHAAAAIESKHKILNRPCVVIAGGREPTQWEAYPHHRFLSVNGCLDCCENGGCWKSRCQKVGDGDEKDQKDLCSYPVNIGENLQIPMCMQMIKPEHVIRAIELYYEGGILKYNKGKI